MRSALVSIIIPTFGRAAFLEDCLASVRGQTYAALEIIVVDDASEPAVNIDSDARTVLLRHARNMGPGAARNTGLAHATGELVLFLDDDDLLAARRLEMAVAEIGTARAHASAVEWLHPDGRAERRNAVFRGDLRSTYNLPHPSMGQVVHRREDVLQFDPTLRMSEDLEWWIRMSASGVYAWSDEVGLRVRRHTAIRPHVPPKGRVETRREVYRRHRHSVDKRARALLRSKVASAAIADQRRGPALGWALRALVSDPSLHTMKLLALSCRPW